LYKLKKKSLRITNPRAVIRSTDLMKTKQES